jgi:GNAT superfamily N-acetyltransferase
MLTVRPATERDISALCDLYLDFHEFHVKAVPARLASIRDVWEEEKERLAVRLSEIIGDSNSVVLVAEDEGELRGLSELYLREEEETRGRVGRRYCYVQSMFVVRSRRGEGIGRMLLSASESWARAGGACEMRLDVWEFSEGPLAFYERFGYGTCRRSLARDLD